MEPIPELVVSGLAKKYAAPVLSGVSFRLSGPGITGLVGRNGAGKTTLLQTITGRDFADSGMVQMFGQHPLENSEIQAQLCFVKEGQYYPDDFTVAQALRWAGRIHAHWDRQQASEISAAFQIPMDRKVRKLSRGMISALNAIIGLASCAPVTIFDEPYIGMDPVARHTFYQHLLASYAANPRMIILSTHLIDEVAGVLEHLLLLDRGRIVLDENVDVLRAQSFSVAGPAAAMAEFVADRTVLHYETHGQLARAALRTELAASDRAITAKLGLEISPLSLQQLIVAIVAPARESA